MTRSTEEAKRLKDNPDLQDRSAPQREEEVKDNARSTVFVSGGDVSDIHAPFIQKECAGSKMDSLKQNLAQKERWFQSGPEGPAFSGLESSACHHPGFLTMQLSILSN